MKKQSDPPTENYSKSLAITMSQGGASRELEYFEHHRAQGTVLKRKYRRP